MLGSSEVTLVDLARVYGAFANGGYIEPIHTIKRILDKDGNELYAFKPKETESYQALSPQITHLMVEGMRQVLLRGTGYKASKLGYAAAGKTGTSNNSTDNWFNGFTPNLVSIRLGRDRPSQHHHRSVRRGHSRLTLVEEFHGTGTASTSQRVLHGSSGGPRRAHQQPLWLPLSIWGSHVVSR